MRKVFQDPEQPGIIRFEDDFTAGILIGREARNVAKAINCHDDLVEVVSAMAKFSGRNNNAGLKDMAKAVLAKIEATNNER